MAKILLADDSAHAQRMGAKILAAEGHQVVTVGNGQAAVQSLEKSVPDLVVADIYMPGRDGFEVCHFIKSDDRLKDIPVLLTIGAMEPYDPERGRKARADGLITKPLESSNLIATVKQLLSSAKGGPARRPKRTPVPPPEPAPAAEETVSSHWEQPVDEAADAPAPGSIVIPEEMNQQPVGMLTEPPDGSLQSDPPLSSAPVEVSLDAASVMDGPGMSWPPITADALSPLVNGPASGTVNGVVESGAAGEPASAAQLEPVPVSIWIAEAMTATDEDEKLFEHPQAAWAGLAEQENVSAPVASLEPPLAALESSEPQPVHLPGDYYPAAAEAGDSSAEPVHPVQSGLESFDSLNAVVAAPPIAPPAGDPPENYEPPMPAADSVPDTGLAELPDVSWSTSPQTTEDRAAESAELDPGLDTAAVEQEYAAISLSPDAPVAVDELVRQAVEQMLPQLVDQIVERVLQSLKN